MTSTPRAPSNLRHSELGIAFAAEILFVPYAGLLTLCAVLTSLIGFEADDIAVEVISEIVESAA